MEEGVSASKRETFASVFGRFLCESAKKDGKFLRHHARDARRLRDEGVRGEVPEAVL